MTMKEVLAERENCLKNFRNVCVLASGDPFFFGVGRSLSRMMEHDEMKVFPAPSSFSLAASRLGWALQDVEMLSVLARPIEQIRPYLQNKNKILLLTDDNKTPERIAEYLMKLGFGSSRIIVLEALGGEHERIREYKVESFKIKECHPLNIIALELVPDANALVLPYSTGLEDSFFEHDGQITKRIIRAVTLSSLGPRHGEILWDIGAGSGSVSIEWMLCHPSMKAYAIESKKERVERIKRNASHLGVPGLHVIHGKAPQVLSNLPQPDSIFIGGGGSAPNVLEQSIKFLKSGGRLVANAVTLEMESILLKFCKDLGGELNRLDCSTPQTIGNMEIWRPALPVTQWVWTKP